MKREIILPEEAIDLLRKGGFLLASITLSFNRGVQDKIIDVVLRYDGKTFTIYEKKEGSDVFYSYAGSESGDCCFDIYSAFCSCKQTVLCGIYMDVKFVLIEKENIKNEEGGVCLRK